ncbi:expressed unknown protein [Seminavis robusta]|uniref:Uncharacterized protein n=1 Tax=Seminavis robusta TaxID=568900 RepID=A0A9N8H8Y2_9STRA|nr:expressed unknown protein [Seminavis robusta]|eukprot:Sro235_g094740.1 n/a (569) ;mRNA; f:47810-50020
MDLPDAGVPRMHHGAFADFSSSSRRHLSSDQNYSALMQQQLSGNDTTIRSEQQHEAGQTSSERNSATRNKTLTLKSNSVYPQNQLRGAYASVPRPVRPSTDAPENNSSVDPEKQLHGAYASVPLSARPTSDELIEAALKKKRRQRGRRRRREHIDGEEYKDTDLSKNITSYSYLPIGKYVTSALEERSEQAKTNGNTSSPYAYAFVMGGVNEQDGRYLGMFYNILIAAYIFDKEGSSADVVVYVQMSANSTLTELPEDNTRLLTAMGVKIKYLPKPKVENFHQIIMQKLVILELVEYRRVIFLDTDVMPFCNLDYVFHLSDSPKPVLKKNLIIALSGSPANAGFFMLAPKPGEIEKLRKIVAKQQARAKDKGVPFDENRGWGHVIKPPDAWWTINKKHKRRRWKFVGSHADQGLLYHWVKYYKRSASIVSGEEVDNYGPIKTKDRIQLEKTLYEPFKQYTCFPRKYERTFGELPTYDAQGMAPYRDFVHFLGSNKPWRQHLPPPIATNIEAETPEQYWFHMLRLLNQELDIGIDFGNWTRIKRTPLGSHPKKDLMVQLLEANQTLVQT